MGSIAARSTIFRMSEHVNPSVEFAKNLKSALVKVCFTCSKHFSISVNRASLFGSSQYTRCWNRLMMPWSIFHGYSLFDWLELYGNRRSQHKNIVELLLDDVHFILESKNGFPLALVQTCVLREHSIIMWNTWPQGYRVSILWIKRMQGFFLMASLNAFLMTLRMSGSAFYLLRYVYWVTIENIC